MARPREAPSGIYGVNPREGPEGYECDRCGNAIKVGDPYWQSVEYWGHVDTWCRICELVQQKRSDDLDAKIKRILENE